MSFLKGWLGEQRVRLTQRLGLDSTEYRCFSDVFLKVNLRYTQVDHVIVSKYGVFVVETKNRGGRIYGKPSDSSWTQVFFKARFQFPNPLRQNYLHSRGVAKVCGIDESKIHPVVVFCGRCSFKTEMPENVVKRSQYIKYIKSKRAVLLTDAEVSRINRSLEMNSGGLPFITGYRHAQIIRHQRLRQDICPRCGGRLLVRIARRGKRTGEKFVGCENYPECTFTNKLQVR